MLTRHRRKTLLLFDGTDLTVDPGESSFSFDDYDITANGIASATGAIVARNAAGDPLSGKTAVLAIETIAVSAANSLVTCAPAEAANDGTESIILTFRAMDASNRPIPDMPASDIVFAATGTGNTVTQPTGSTNAGGYISGSMVSTVAAAKTVSVTCRGVSITDTATATFTASPPAAGFTNEPVGMTMVAEWNNEATLNAGGWSMEAGSSPGASGGTTTRVTSGYPDTPVIGGSAVIYNQQPGGAAGGNGPGRLEHYFVDGTVDEIFIGLEAQVTAANTTSTAGGGNKIIILTFTNGRRYFLDFDDATGAAGMFGCWGLYDQSTFMVKGSELLTYGQVFKVEWYINRAGGAGAGYMQVWVDGVLALNHTGMTIPTVDFQRAYKEWTNNGNRTTASPVTRVIGEDAGADTANESWISALYMSTR